MSGINISGHYWFALRTPVNREFKAVAALQARGYATAVPYEMRRRRRNRHSRAVIRLPHADITRYVLTGFPTPVPPWRALFNDPELEPLLDGVVSVTSNGLPSLIRPKAIYAMQARYGDAIFEAPPRRVQDFEIEPDLQIGDVARIGRWERSGFTEGGFAGKVVTIQDIQGDIAKVLLPMFGTEKLVPVPLERLAAA